MTLLNTFFASPQNSVRHTLSVRQRFLRLPRMINGIVSHKSWWTLSEEFLKKRTSLELKAFNLLPQSANGKQANQETQTEDLICSRCSRTLLRDWLHCIEVNHLGTQKIIHVHTIFISNYFAFVKSGLRVRLNVTFFLQPNTIYFFTFNSSGGEGGGVGWGWGLGGEGFFYNGLYSGNSALYSGYCRDLELVPSLGRARNIKSLFQSNVCNLFLTGI